MTVEKTRVNTSIMKAGFSSAHRKPNTERL